MTDYAKFVSRFLYSKNSDYSDPKVDTKSLLTELTPDEWDYRELEVTIGAHTIDLDNHFGAVTGILVHFSNTFSGTATTITVTFTSGSTACSVDLLKGGTLALANVGFDESANLGLTADVDTGECEIVICGS